MDDPFDRIGRSISSRLMKAATWIPRGKGPRSVRLRFERPYLVRDALGNEVNGAQPTASGLVSVIGAARGGDIFVIDGKRWALKGAPEAYGSGDLCRVGLAGAREEA